MRERDQKDQEYLKNLIILAKQGDEESFEEVYNTYYTPLFRYILSRVKNKQEAEDLTQTTFLKIYKAISTWNESHTSPLSFFFTVAHNSLIDHFRKHSTKEIVSDEVVFQASTEKEDFTYENISYDNSKEVLAQAIDKLSDEQKEIINLFYTSDLSYKEISEITGKKEDAVRQTHSRAIKKLRELYKE
jgi:RNA polymerase sigma-70 factor (ECF subfamily)